MYVDKATNLSYHIIIGVATLAICWEILQDKILVNTRCTL